MLPNPCTPVGERQQQHNNNATTTQQQRNNKTHKHGQGLLCSSVSFWRHLASSGVICHLASSGVIWRHLASSGLIWPHLASSGASDLGGSNFQKNPVVSNKPISLCKVISKIAFWGLGWPRPFFGGSGRPVKRGLMWPHLVSSGLIWRHLASSGVIWRHLASSGLIWRHFAPEWPPRLRKIFISC